MPDETPRPREYGLWLALAGVGVEMVFPIVVGIYLDERFGWSPWGVLAGVGLGLTVCLLHISWIYRQSQKPPDEQGPP